MSVKYAILGLLHYKDMHGYRIKEVIENEFGFMWSINYGQIYPTLKRLEADGLVTKVDVAQKNAPDKKLYSVSEKGRRAFAEWLSCGPERGMLIRDPFLLKFIFFSFGDRDKALEIIEGEIENYRRGLDNRRQRYHSGKSESVYAQLMRELGISLNEAMLTWLLKARQEIQADVPSTEKKTIVMK